MNQALFWGGLGIMLVTALFVGREPLARYMYCGGLALADISLMTDTTVTVTARAAGGTALTVVLIAYLALPVIIKRLEQAAERNKHAREEVHEGQVDGVGPEEAQGREDV